nr:LamG domain-containing protein [Cellulomonas sp. APG4]
MADPDGNNVKASFELWDISTGKRIWGPVTTAYRYTNRSHSAAVPAGVTANGGRYQWRVKGIDAYGLAGPSLSCEFAVDTAEPAPPAVSPVAGQPAFYDEEGVHGGVGASGSFTLQSSSSDVVSYRYSFTTDSLGSAKSGHPVQVAFTPAEAGPTNLYVQAIDRAGNASAVRQYRFYVAFPGRTASWSLDEGTGTIASNDVAGGPPFTLDPGVTWGAGLLQHEELDPDDGALVFDADDDTASTSGAVVATDQSFTVEATVRLDAIASSATAVSNDGVVNSGFELGMTASSACPTGDGRCWTFRMPSADTSGAPAAVAYSTVPVEQGTWVRLIGMHSRPDDGPETVQLAVCEYSDPADVRPVASEPVDATAAWNSTLPLRIARATEDGEAARPWRGALGEVQVWDGVRSWGQVHDSCARVVQ